MPLDLLDPETARAWMLPLHGGVGLLALIGGTGAILTKKGSPAHRRAGQLFMLGMAGAVLFAVPVLIATGNLFLTGMGAFAAYMSWTGWRIARQRAAAGGPLDRGVSGLMIVLGLLFAAFGAIRFAQGAGGLAVVPIAMGLGSAAFARQHLRWYRAPAAARRPWVAEHLGAAGGGFIAGLTAFGAAAGTNLLPQVPEALLWLAPAAVLSPLLMRWGKRVEAETKAKRASSTSSS
ncbi:MAG: hypothetical protein JNM72_27570 [Deltaproteobacteria bacterium]|jgi:hypothetical protein|nr:hypothetical protein [Deltaproteobacteria bacterium]